MTTLNEYDCPQNATFYGQLKDTRKTWFCHSSSCFQWLVLNANMMRALVVKVWLGPRPIISVIPPTLLRGK